MNFLRVFGATALKVTQIVLGIQPYLNQASTISRAVSDVGKLLKVIMDVEAVIHALHAEGIMLTPEQMIAAEVPLVSQVILDVLNDLNTKFRIQDEAAYREGVAQLTNGLVLVLKSGHPDGVTTISKA